MKLFLIAALAVLASVHGEVEYEKLNAASINRSENHIGYYLLTRWNPESYQVLIFNGRPLISTSNFLKTRSTRVIIYGWQSDQFEDAIDALTSAYLKAGDYNVILVDCSIALSGSYASAKENVPAIAADVSSTLNMMNQDFGLDLSTTQLIGHFLGAHIAGIAARDLEGLQALDPAGPGFEDVDQSGGLRSSDAVNVQVIHTNAGEFGLSRNAGTSDFYPNGGSRQPGCELSTAGFCSSYRAYEYFAESIGNPSGFQAIGESGVFMGGETLTYATGSFALETAESSPFALG